MSSAAVYMTPEQGKKMIKAWCSVVAKIILAACFGLTVMVIQGAPFFYEVPVLILAYVLLSGILTHRPLKRLPKRMLIRPEFTARMAELPKELFLLGIVLLFFIPTAAFVASGSQTAPFFLNIRLKGHFVLVFERF